MSYYLFQDYQSNNHISYTNVINYNYLANLYLYFNWALINQSSLVQLTHLYKWINKTAISHILESYVSHISICKF